MSDSSLKSANMLSIEQLLCENWLNTFSRETRQFDIRIPFGANKNTDAEQTLPFKKDVLFQAISPVEIDTSALAGIHFYHQKISLLAPLNYFSPGGYHSYKGTFYIYRWDDLAVSELTKPEYLAEMITTEIAHLLEKWKEKGKEKVKEKGKEETLKWQHDLLQRMINGLNNVRFFFEKSVEENTPSLSPLVSAEQKLKLGHPFHVISKSSLGFDKKDLTSYAPELGASFKLHFFAIEPERLEEHPLSESTQFYDRKLFNDAFKRLPETYAHYKILAMHPWQAKYLLSNNEIQQLQKDNRLIALGELGYNVSSTSSVRTVWAPEDRYFLKLPLNVRITNFLRNNPPEHGQRALDVSRAIHALPLALWRSEHFYVVIEEGYQLLKTKDQALQAATLVIQRQALCDEYSDNAQVLSALLEPQPGTHETLLYSLLQSAASSNKTLLDAKLIDTWWLQYLRISLLPLLKLFSEGGVSLEGHLQNSLLACENGWPKRFYIRDMEGASINRDIYQNRKDSCVKPNSPAMYSAEEAWFRFKYYVVVNHVNHFASSLARTGLTTESRLWRLLDELLDNTIAPNTQPWVRDLQLSTRLPSKMNMLSCFAQHGETPSWGDIPNPLYLAHKYRQRFFEQDEIRYNDELQLLNDPQYLKAQRRVIRQTLEALLFEKVIKPSQWVDNLLILKTQSPAGDRDTEISYQCDAIMTDSFDRIRLLSENVYRVSTHNGKTLKTLINSVDTLLNELRLDVDVQPERWQGFIQELLHTTLKHGQSLQGSTPALLRKSKTEQVESRITDGHPYHPSFKSRLGFTLADSLRYAPELSAGFRPILVAARKSLCHGSIVNGLNMQDLLTQEGISKWLARLEPFNVSGDEYLPIPVHPWQWSQVILPLYQDALSRQDLVPLGLMDDTYLPQQSIRTLTNASTPNKCYLKLSISLINTSTKRLLPAHTLKNAAPISSWLSKIVEEDKALPDAHKPMLLKEIAAVGFSPRFTHSEHAGALACIWRESIEQITSDPKQKVVPLQALTTVDADGRPFIDDWIAQHELIHWLRTLIKRVYIPVLHLLWAHGVALESHAQNMGVNHHSGLPHCAVLKDFHDGVRFNRQWLSDTSLLDHLVEAPIEHRRINPNSYLEEKNTEDLRDFVYDALFFVNLAELAWFLSCHYKLSENDFWSLVSDEVLAYQASHLNLLERFTVFDIFAEEVSIEKLASRRFSDSPNISIRVKNPLYKARARKQVNAEPREVHAHG